jgi:hypothetical protein
LLLDVASPFGCWRGVARSVFDCSPAMAMTGRSASLSLSRRVDRPFRLRFIEPDNPRLAEFPLGSDCAVRFCPNPSRLAHVQGREARRSAGTGAGVVRAGDQPQDREGTRPRCARQAARARRRGDRVSDSYYHRRLGFWDCECLAGSCALADQARGCDHDPRDECSYAAIQQDFIKDVGHDRLHTSTP